jgi:hypothetical protein
VWTIYVRDSSLLSQQSATSRRYGVITWHTRLYHIASGTARCQIGGQWWAVTSHLAEMHDHDLEKLSCLQWSVRHSDAPL